MASFNFGLYALVILIPATIFAGIKAIGHEGRKRVVVVLTILVVLLSPPLGSRFGPQTAWKHELFIPCNSIFEVNHDLLFIAGGRLPGYVLRRKNDSWKREATFIRREGEIVIAEDNEYGTEIKDCRRIDSDRSYTDLRDVSNREAFGLYPEVTQQRVINRVVTIDNT